MIHSFFKAIRSAWVPALLFSTAQALADPGLPSQAGVHVSLEQAWAFHVLQPAAAPGTRPGVSAWVESYDWKRWEGEEPRGRGWGLERSRERRPSRPDPSATGFPSRRIELDFESPMDHVEANSRLWYSANQLFARGNDLAGVGLALDGHVAGRLLLLAGAVYLSGGLSFYSHEVAHTYEDRRQGVRENFSVNGGRWVHLGYPDYVKNFAWGEPTWGPAEDLRAVGAGVNQTTHNGRFALRRRLVRDRLDFTDGLIFLEGQLDHLLQIAVGYVEEDEDNDANLYTALLKERGLRLHRSEYLALSMAADLLSFPVWESLFAVGRYLACGERDAKPFRVPVARGLSVAPPVFSLYLTPEGLLFDAGVFLLPDGFAPVELSLCRRADFRGESSVRGVRAGAKIHEWWCYRRSSWGVSASPYVYLDVRGAGEVSGGLAGAELAVAFFGAALTLRLEYAENDLVRNLVQQEEKGFRAVLGCRLRI